jgi:hypothetical protein
MLMVMITVILVTVIRNKSLKVIVFIFMGHVDSETVAPVSAGRERKSNQPRLGVEYSGASTFIKFPFSRCMYAYAKFAPP